MDLTLEEAQAARNTARRLMEQSRIERMTRLYHDPNADKTSPEYLEAYHL